MDERIFQEVQNYISFKKDLGGQTLSDAQCDEKAEAKLKELLSERPEKYEQAEFEQKKSDILAFMNTDEVQKRKVLAYSLDFKDPTEKKTVVVNSSGEQVMLNYFLEEDKIAELAQFIKKHGKDDTFSSMVFRIMDNHGLTAPQVYRAAMMRRQDFSRAIDPKERNVSRMIVWQIIIGLQCSIEEADDLLFSAGYVRRNNRFDLTMSYFIESKNYDVMAINEVLEALKQKVFSCYRPAREVDNL